MIRVVGDHFAQERALEFEVVDGKASLDDQLHGRGEEHECASDAEYDGDPIDGQSGGGEADGDAGQNEDERGAVKHDQRGLQADQALVETSHLSAVVGDAFFTEFGGFVDEERFHTVRDQAHAVDDAAEAIGAGEDVSTGGRNQQGRSNHRGERIERCREGIDLNYLGEIRPHWLLVDSMLT